MTDSKLWCSPSQYQSQLKGFCWGPVSFWWRLHPGKWKLTSPSRKSPSYHGKTLQSPINRKPSYYPTVTKGMIFVNKYPESNYWLNMAKYPQSGFRFICWGYDPYEQTDSRFGTSLASTKHKASGDACESSMCSNLVSYVWTIYVSVCMHARVRVCTHITELWMHTKNQSILAGAT